MCESELEVEKREEGREGARRVKPATGKEGAGGIRGAPGLIAVHSDVLDHTPEHVRLSASVPLLVLVKYRCQGPELY